MADEEVPTPDPISENPDDQPDTPDEQPEAPIVETTTALLPNNAGFEVVNTTLEDEMRQSYLNYAMSTIISRALPDVRDGLKPVQRRILMAMSDLNLTPAAQQRKSAKIAGDTSGNYHPHGEAVIYPTMVRMAQDFSLRYPLVDGQGNFGSIDGDPPAAMRYTEARMSHFAMEMLQDLDRDTVNWTENYDQTREEPTVLPGKFPNLICNGGSGIAVGMATNIPPHNLREIVDALYHLIDNPDATSDELMTFVKGPDFPTYGLILGTKGIRLAYATGRGSVIMQARTTIEPMENGRNAIIITELPYQVIKQRLIEQIAELVKQKKIEGIVNLNDYTDKTGMRVVVELKREAYPKKVLNFLLKHTPMRSTFGVNMIALIEGQPQILSLPQVLNAFLKHRREVIVRRTIFELNKAKARAHILEGLRIALDFLDEIIALIRASRTAEIARTEMMARFTLSQLQADAILQMQLRTLTGLAREQVENEYKELLRQIGFYEDILATPARVEAIIRTELKFLRDKYGDERRTRIVPMEAEEIGDEDLIPEEEMIISITRDGYIKRVPKETYPTQHRGGKGRIGATTKEEDTIEHLFIATTHHYILFFTDRGRVYRLKAYEVPQTSRTAMGSAVINLINIQPGERITATVPIKDYKEATGYLLLATECGEVKRTKLAEFANLRNNGLNVFDIEENDSLRWVAHTSGDNEVIMVTRKGMSIRFHENEVPSRGRAAGGVRGIRLSEEKGDSVVGMALVDAELDLLVIGERGISKRTPFKEYRSQSRGGKGILTMALSEKTGNIVDAQVVDKDDRLLIMTREGITIRLRVDDIRSSGRSTQGVRAINLSDNDTVASVERITADKLPIEPPAAPDAV
ncbi:MAG: DNA gyrase subunit A [Capsulimonas sp.]|uniref:DNA gyrase subunit A n=1 Tax=Capsulimonas sp. TaxID=2494211 RepID=UPI003265F44E